MNYAYSNKVYDNIFAIYQTWYNINIDSYNKFDKINIHMSKSKEKKLYKRYNAVLPLVLYKQVVKLAEMRFTSVANTLITAIKLYLYLHEWQKKNPDDDIILKEKGADGKLTVTVVKF